VKVVAIVLIERRRPNKTLLRKNRQGGGCYLLTVLRQRGAPSGFILKNSQRVVAWLLLLHIPS